jgi:uncharacterized protein (DUF342 family)
MAIYMIERENNVLAVVEAANYKQALIEYALGEGIGARVASKDDLFQYMRDNGVTKAASEADGAQRGD